MIIFIDQLVLNIRIGVFPEEKITPQKCVISVECSLYENLLDVQKSEKNYLCYKTLVENIQTHFENKHTELVEMAAEEIAAICLNHPLCQKVVVKVGKPGAISNASMVGCSIIRIKNQA